jgi:hypothetical protein
LSAIHVYREAISQILHGRFDMIRQKAFLVLCTWTDAVAIDAKTFLDVAGACERGTVQVPSDGRRIEGRSFAIPSPLTLPCPTEKRDAVMLVIDRGAPDLSVPLVVRPLSGIAEPARGPVHVSAQNFFSL